MAQGLDERDLRRVLDAARDLMSDLDLEGVLSRVLATAAEVSGARYAALGVLNRDRTGLERFLHHGIDERTRAEIGALPSGQGVLGLLISDPRPLRLADVSEHPDSYGFPPGHPPMRSFLGVPITIRGEQWGNLYLTEKEGGGEFDAADEEATVILATWAGIAIENARSIASERLRLAMDAAEQERLAWARELHDETLQGLAAVRMILANGWRRGGEHVEPAIHSSLEQLDREIAALRALISDLRPDSLDRIGVEAALEGLVERIRSRGSSARFEVDAEPSAERLDPGLEVAIYRVLQEAMTNAVRHSDGEVIRVAIERSGTEVVATVADDGQGFDKGAVEMGYGIMGMRERAELAGGRLEISSERGRGTRVRLVLSTDATPDSVD